MCSSARKTMKVILLKTIRRLGNENDVVEVKDGYGRNYLIPEGFALRAVKENFKKLEEIKKKRVKLAQKAKEDALAQRSRLEKISVTITAEVKEEEEIYGSVGKMHIAKALEEEKVKVDKEQIILEEPIRKLGVYNLKVKLYPEVEAEIRVWIVKK